MVFRTEIFRKDAYVCIGADTCDRGSVMRNLPCFQDKFDGKFGVILMIVIVGIIEIAAVNAVTDQKLKTSFKETLEKQLQKLSNDKEGRL